MEKCFGFKRYANRPLASAGPRGEAKKAGSVSIRSRFADAVIRAFYAASLL